MNTGIRTRSISAGSSRRCSRGWGGAELLRQLRDRAPAGGAAQRRGVDRQSRAHAGDARAAPAAAGDVRARPGRRRRAQGVWRLVHRDDAARVVHERLSPRLPLRRLADRRARTARRRRRSETSTYTQTARPGARAPHVWLADGRSTLDLFGRGFVLLRLGGDAPAGEGLQRAARRARRAA